MTWSSPSPLGLGFPSLDRGVRPAPCRSPVCTLSPSPAQRLCPPLPSSGEQEDAPQRAGNSTPGGSPLQSYNPPVIEETDVAFPVRAPSLNHTVVSARKKTSLSKSLVRVYLTQDAQSQQTDGRFAAYFTRWNQRRRREEGPMESTRGQEKAKQGSGPQLLSSWEPGGPISPPRPLCVGEDTGLSCAPKRSAQALTSGTCECDLIWKWGLQRCNSLR